MMKPESRNLSDRELLNRILDLLENQHKRPTRTEKTDKSRVYDNKALMALLNIKDKYLKKLRDNGHLSYSQCGEKYWYTQEDVDRFLSRFHYEAFSVGEERLP